MFMKWKIIVPPFLQLIKKKTGILHPPAGKNVLRMHTTLCHYLILVNLAVWKVKQTNI